MFHSLCLTLPPTPASVPSSFRGAVGRSGMSREPGEAGSAHKGWDGEEGVHADTSDERDGRGLGGAGVGGQLGSQAAGRVGTREGLGWMVLIVCLGLGEKGKGLF